MTLSRHISVSIAAPAATTYAYAADPANLPTWAAGLARTTIEQVDGHWVAASPMGRVRVDFTPANNLGVLDHTVTLPSGEQVLNPLRVIPTANSAKSSSPSASAPTRARTISKRTARQFSRT